MLYKRYIKNHFFNKILMVYILITLVFCGILFITLSKNLVSIKSEEALVVSDQILNIVDLFMKDKLENARDVHQKLLRNKNTWRMIEEELAEGETTAFGNDLQSEREAMMHNVYAIDGEFYGMFFFNHETGKSIRLGNMENIQVNHFIKMAAESEEKKRLQFVFIPEEEKKIRVTHFQSFCSGRLMILRILRIRSEPWDCVSVPEI